jgi:hypothetical protein
VLYKAVELASSFFDLQKLTFFGCASRLRLVPNKISGVGTNFGLLVHVLPGPNKQRSSNKYVLS